MGGRDETPSLSFHDPRIGWVLFNPTHVEDHVQNPRDEEDERDGEGDDEEGESRSDGEEVREEESWMERVTPA